MDYQFCNSIDIFWHGKNFNSQDIEAERRVSAGPNTDQEVKKAAPLTEFRVSEGETVFVELDENVLLEPISPESYDLSYTCLIIPRFPSHILRGDIAGYLPKWLQQICISYGWRLGFTNVQPEYERFLGARLSGDPWDASTSTANGGSIHPSHPPPTGNNQIAGSSSQSNAKICKCLTSHYNELENFYAAYLKYYGTGPMD
jgi:hypothetical protein